MARGQEDSIFVSYLFTSRWGLGEESSGKFWKSRKNNTSWMGLTWGDLIWCPWEKLWIGIPHRPCRAPEATAAGPKPGRTGSPTLPSFLSCHLLILPYPAGNSSPLISRPSHPGISMWTQLTCDPTFCSATWGEGPVYTRTHQLLHCGKSGTGRGLTHQKGNQAGLQLFSGLRHSLHGEARAIEERMLTL